MQLKAAAELSDYGAFVLLSFSISRAFRPNRGIMELLR
jgi:hypothetical protein